MCTQNLCGADWDGYVRPIISNATGKYIKENTPFDMTFICSCTNLSQGYLPTMEAYDYDCYESYTSYFSRGTAENLQVEFVNMLNGLK